MSSPHTPHRQKRARRRARAQRLRDRLPLILPCSERLEELHDLVVLHLADVIDAHCAHLDIVVEQEVEQLEEPVELVVIRSGGERRIWHARARLLALDVLCEPEQSEATIERPHRIGHLEVLRQMCVRPVDEARVYEGRL